MEANELRIGNYISIPQYGTTENIITAVTPDILANFHAKGLHSERYNPIPLTEEWLVKFGFEESYTSSVRTKFDHKNKHWIGFDFSHVEDKSMEGFRYYGHYIKIQYIHQLQNLYFALTGIELTQQQ